MDLLQNIGKMLRREKGETALRAAQHGMGGSAPHKDNPRVVHAADPELSALVVSARDGTGAVVAGSLELLGLDDVRQAAGEQWDAIAVRARSLAEAEIREHLAQGDYLRTHSDTSYVICFALLGKTEAEARAKRISAAVKSRLCAEMPELGEDLSVLPFVAEVDPDEFKDGEGSLADKLMAKMEAMRRDAERAAATQRRTIVKDFQMRFSPVWHTVSHTTPINRCLLDTALHSTTLARFHAMTDKVELIRTLADLDFLRLTSAVEAIHRVQSSNLSTKLLVPVCYQTLSFPECRNTYMRLLHSVPIAYRSSLILEIAAIPDMVSAPQVYALCEMLRPQAERLVVELQPTNPLLAALAQGDAWGLSTNVANLNTRDPAFGSLLRDFVEAAASKKMVAFARGANALGLALAADEAKFAYIDGPAIHLAAAEPRPPSRLKALARTPQVGTAPQRLHKVS